MLLDFQTANYRSFRGLARLNLAASNYDGTTLSGNVMAPELPGIAHDKFLRGAAIYGANASGKTNIIRAIADLQAMVRYSHTRELGSGLPQDPFLLDGLSKSEPTLYAIRFVSATGVRYHYQVAYDAARVHEESLSAFPKGREQLWYHRQWTGEGDDYVYSPDESSHFNIRKADIETTKSNALFLSTAANILNHPKLGDVYGWFRDTLNVINLGVGSEDFEFANGYTSVKMGDYFIPIRISDGGHGKLKKTISWSKSSPERVLHYLQLADLGIAKVEIREHGSTTKKRPSFWSAGFLSRQPEIQIHHSGKNGKTYQMDLSQQSAGTQRYFELIGQWIDLIEKGQVLFVDELETSLHPLLTRELIRIVMTPELNPKGAQVIFATHDPLLLDAALLRRDQVWLTEKTKEGDSILYALDDYERPPTKRESLVKGYLAGLYGGIPSIPETLFTTPARKAEVEGE